jgi:hypothetical protein
MILILFAARDRAPNALSFSCERVLCVRGGCVSTCARVGGGYHKGMARRTVFIVEAVEIREAVVVHGFVAKEHHELILELAGRIICPPREVRRASAPFHEELV